MSDDGWGDDDGGDGWGSDPDEQNPGEESNDPKIIIENSFHEGEAIMKESPEYALELLEKCATLEAE